MVMDVLLAGLSVVIKIDSMLFLRGKFVTSDQSRDYTVAVRSSFS